MPRIIIAARREKTDPTSDLRVQALVANMSGALIDLAWRAPDFDAANRQLVGFELFRDDMSTEPPSRLTSALMPGQILEARGLEVLPHSEYGVQPIWRIAEAGPTAVIQFGPPRLTRDLAGPGIFVPPEERIHSLAFLQRQGAITSEELELAVERFLGRAQPVLAGAPTTMSASGMGGGAAGSARTRRVVLAYIAIAVVLVAVLVVAEQLVGRLLVPQPSAARIATSPSAQPSPSAEPSPSPVATALVVDLHPILIQPTDLRPGYIVASQGSKPLCPACLPAVSSLAVQLQNRTLKRTILSAASIAPSSGDTKSVATALMTYRSSGGWKAVAGLGDAGFANTIVYSKLGQTYYVVVWRTGVMTNEIVLIVPAGMLSVQSAIDLARVQQARVAKALS